MARAKPFTVSQILAWADAHRQQTGQWPSSYTGTIRGTRENRRRVDSALRLGLRGLAGGTSLAQLLATRRGIRNRGHLPRLTMAQVLRWADAHHRRTGSWPRETSGRVLEAPCESWFAIDRALRAGVRGFTGSSSLARLLAERRRVRNIQSLARLSVKRILAWADAHRRRTGAWPTSHSGPIAKAPGETWSGVNAALQAGRRGFRGGSSLARLLARHRGVRNPKQPTRLTVKQIVHWAEDYRRRTGSWPDRNAGPVRGVDGETWAMVDRALSRGKRGLPGGSSLYRLLDGRQGK